MVEVPSNSWAHVMRLVVGALVVGAGLYYFGRSDDLLSQGVAGRVIEAATCVAGVVMAASGVRSLVTRSPQLLATDLGVSFAGSAMIAWSEIAQVFETKISGEDGDRAAIGLSLRTRRIVRELPPGRWLRALVVREVKIAVDHVTERPTAFVVNLETLRRAAPRKPRAGGRAVRASKRLPEARMIKRP